MHAPLPVASTKKIPFLDLRVTDELERAQMHDALERVMRHGRFVNGPEVEELERNVASLCCRRYGIGVGSGTDALVVALRALEIGAGGEVIIPALSFVATANAVRLAGAEPVFADIGDDLNIDPDGIKPLITQRTKAIIAVHWSGRVCAMNRILAVARAHNIRVIEDASQAYRAKYWDRVAGFYGDIACFSMNPMKTFGALGEAGMIVTDQEAYRLRCVELRYHGMYDKEDCVRLSGNHRLDTLQAAFLLVREARMRFIINSRRAIAGLYNEKLKPFVTVPFDGLGEQQVYYTYTIRTHRRDELKAYLEERGIETKVQHRLLMPQQALYKPAAKGEWSKAAQLVQEVLCLPCHENMRMEDAERVADCVTDFFA